MRAGADGPGRYGLAVADYPRMERLDAHAVVERVRDAGGPDLAVVAPLPGGSVGAAIVRSPDGHESVLKLLPPPIAGSDAPDLATVDALVDAARAVGVPAPAHEGRFELGDGAVATLQERAPGVEVTQVSDAFVERMLELARVRVGAVPPSLRGAPSPLYLIDDGPGFCLHGPLRDRDARTRDLLARIETIGAQCDDAPGDDVVHFDYHGGNVLVAPNDPDDIVAVVDWTGARAASIALDLASMLFDLSWWPDHSRAPVEAELRSMVTETQFLALWAHMALRLVDWSIRHFPHNVDHLVEFSFGPL
jgi:aminoglycoside phosphotransferase (APT) family kinase protein